MRKTSNIIFAVAFAVALSLGCSDQGKSASKDNEKNKADKTDKSMSKKTVPEGYVVVDVKVIDSLSDAAQLHFTRARRALLDGNDELAAAEFRTGAALVRLQASRAAGDVKKDLAKEADELDAFADRIQKGAVKEVKELDDEAARAYQTLANHKYVQASEAWSEKRYADAKGALDSALSSMEYGLERAESEVSDAYQGAIDTGRDASKEIESGADAAADEVGESMRFVGKKIGEWGKALEDEK